MTQVYYFRLISPTNKMKLFFSVLLILNFIIVNISTAQQQKSSKLDTLYQLPTASVSAYLSEQPYLSLPSSIGLITQSTLDIQQGNTFLPALNTIPGVRMEERSPGSYRLSIRGSLLRSPFGIRNVKIYLDEIPLTDAAGNSYLNALDPIAFNNITVLKGPDGSLFGANSGGVVVIRPNGMEPTSLSTIRLTANAGSYGSFNQSAAANYQVNDTYRFSLDYGHQQADGYRKNTANHRHYVQTVQRFRYTPKNELRIIGLYSSMAYQTPGGLTEAQYAADPKQARPAAGPNPGAIEQQAAIYNNTLWGGLVHDTHINPHWKHVLAVFGTYTDFTNPFITNYEKRYEKNVGFRSYFTYSGNDQATFTWQANAGLEWQQSQSDILNYDNLAGIKGDEQQGDRLQNHQHFYFARFSGNLADRLTLETAISLNGYNYRYKSLFPERASDFDRVSASPTWMPRATLSYLITPQLSWRFTVARGFSPPTSEEVRPSDQVVNTSLQPETGWNKETGIRWQSYNNRLQADISIFDYRMHQAIVRRNNENGDEFFTNAGGIRQRGLEAAFQAWITEPNTDLFIQGLRLFTNITWNHFRFADYTDAENDYSGNALTGVPGEGIVSGLHTFFPKNISFYLQHQYTSRIPLNDANSVYANHYHLLQAKLMWRNVLFSKAKMQWFIGADNLLNEKYSLGNDINAFGNRFFNAAMPRNYYVGFEVRI